MMHWFYFTMGIGAGVFLVFVAQVVLTWIIIRLEPEADNQDSASSE